MNSVALMGRLTRDPEVRVSQGGTAVAKYGLAVDRIKKGEADFINCIAFGKSADFAEKYLHKGMKIAVTGRIQTGSYTNKEGQKVYTTDVIVMTQDFCESKSENTDKNPSTDSDGFMNIPDNIEDEIPFN